MKELYTESLIALQREKYKRVQALNVASIVFFISAIASVITSYIKSMESVWIGLFAVTMIAAVVLLWSMSARMVYAKNTAINLISGSQIEYKHRTDCDENEMSITVQHNNKQYVYNAIN